MNIIGQECSSVIIPGNNEKKNFSLRLKMIVTLFNDSRLVLLDVQPVFHGGLPDRGLALQRVEVGQAPGSDPPRLVLLLHALRIPLRAQRLRTVQPGRVRQQLLGSRQVYSHDRFSEDTCPVPFQ